ncbi:MAG: hypothetical protein ABSB86_01455 [Bryobacteraceae bacterium]
MRSVFRLLSILIALALAVYAGDYISVRYGIPKGRARFGSVNVQRYYAVKLKNQRTELMFQPPEAQQCVYSLFPQLGAAPCWYLERHATQKIDE